MLCFAIHAVPFRLPLREFTDRVYPTHRSCVPSLQVINNYFEPILGEGNAHPAKLFIAGTVDQGGNMINALRLLGIPVLVCSGHRLNSAVGWALGINGSVREDGQGTCRNPVLRDLIAKMTACAVVFSHSPCNNDALADIQRELNDICRALEIVRRNDTRYFECYCCVVHIPYPAESRSTGSEVAVCVVGI